jgi:hypothetical protein
MDVSNMVGIGRGYFWSGPKMKTAGTTECFDLDGRLRLVAMANLCETLVFAPNVIGAK